jgi:hypothetical protein
VHQRYGDSTLIIGNEKLRKISDAIFQEVQPPEDRSRPLEWRRRFHRVTLPLKNVQVIKSCTVHNDDGDLGLADERIGNPVNMIKPNLKSEIAITGILDEDKMRDSIYFAIKENDEEDDKDGDIYGIGSHKGKTTITISSGEPTEEQENAPAGLYWGNAFRMNFEPGEDDLHFELSMPEEQINTLVASLRADQNSITVLIAYLLSYTCELDDALREHYHPQDFVINESTLCFASWSGVTSKIGAQELQGGLEQVEEDDAEYHEKQTVEQRSHSELLQAITSYSKPLTSLVTAIWVLIVVIALNALFR